VGRFAKDLRQLTDKALPDLDTTNQPALGQNLHTRLDLLKPQTVEPENLT